MMSKRKIAPPLTSPQAGGKNSHRILEFGFGISTHPSSLIPHPFKVIGLALICVAMLMGCGSGGSTGPTSTPSSEITILYCRVVDVSGVAHVQWAADVPTRGDVRYGQTTFSNLVTVTALADSHDVVLSGLQFHTHYLYRLTVTDSISRTAQVTGDFTTPTKATPEPIISDFRIINLTDCAVSMSWRTDEPATTILHYGMTALTDSIVKDSLAMDHAVTILNLLPSTTYLLRPEAVDSTNLRGFGPDTSALTTARLTLAFPDTSLALGDTMLLPIYVNDALDLAALRVGITYAPGSVEVIAVEEGPFYSDHRGFVFFSSIRNGSGQLFVDLTWHINYVNDQRTGTDADGSGIVAYARLRGVTPGATLAAFTPDSSFGLDIFSNVRACSLRAGNVEVRP
jgi:hypothetical protein